MRKKKSLYVIYDMWKTGKYEDLVEIVEAEE